MAESSTPVPVSDDQELGLGLSWSSWWQTAKEKSSVALEFMKKDLTEFGQTVHQDAVSAISSTSSAVKQTLRLDDKDSVASQTKEGLQTILGKISDAFYPSLDKEDDEMLVIRDSQPIAVEKWHADLHYIQTHPSNYSHKPDGSKESYQKWLEDFSLETYQQEISETLVGSHEVRNLYTGLVPSILSNLEFWQRFFYRIFQADTIQAKRADLVRRAEGGKALDEFIWDEDETSHQRDQCESEPLKSSASKDNDRSAESSNGIEEQSKIQLKETIKSISSLSIDKTVIINSSPSSSDTDASRKANTEDEWEKDFDLEETNLESKETVTTEIVHDEEWENWE